MAITLPVRRTRTFEVGVLCRTFVIALVAGGAVLLTGPALGQTGTDDDVLFADTESDTLAVEVPQSASREPDKQLERWAARIVTVYAERQLEVGQYVSFRVRLRPGAIWPVHYEWDLGDGIVAVGNNVQHGYQQAGTYTVRVEARNVAGADTASVEVLVVEPEQAVVIASHADEEVEPEPAEVSEADATTIVRRTRTGLRGQETVDLRNGGYSWVVSTYLDRLAADYLLFELRRGGYRSAIFVDDQGPGSPAYRVLVGQFATTETAFAVREAVGQLTARSEWLLDVSEFGAR